nr:uncharacterized mitochondrial protein AtMg00810-like [Tanacetum cinerariifolium]
FSWVFFLGSKDETPPVLKTFIVGLENLLSLKVKIIRCDNETEFKNADLNQFCGLKGIKREFSVPRTPQHNGIAERKNRILIEAARTLLADSLLPIPFWAEAVNTACYVQNRVLVTKPHNKTPYELLHDRLPSSGLAWLFDIDSLSQTMNYHPVITKNQTNSNPSFPNTEKAGEEGTQTYVFFPVLSDGFINSQNNNKYVLVDEKEHDDDIQKSVSSDIHSSSSDAQTRKQDDKTENKDKEADINNMESIISVSHILTTRIHKDHPTSQIIASTSIDAEKPLLKDSDGKDVDVHTYKSMIGSLMYLTSSRLDIIFAVCACARFQMTLKVSHLNAVKRIFKYLKGKPYLGLWYPKDSPFDLVAYSDSDYTDASLDRKSTTGGCQFLGCRLISWQCKKQTVVATSLTEAEYVAAASGCAQVL